MDVDARRLDLMISDEEFEGRLLEPGRAVLPERGWARLYASDVMQANDGADLHLLR